MSFLGGVPSSSNPPGSATVYTGGDDPSVPLLNLSTLQSRMDTLQKFLSESVNSNTLISKHNMEMVSAEISSAIHQIIVNGAALLACTQSTNSSPVPEGLTSGTEKEVVELKREVVADEEMNDDDDYEILELDAVELLAEHIHFCEICGKGFKRDANLRMHMRAHGNQFKTPEALAKPEKCVVESVGLDRKTRFSCPFVGCNRNKQHKKFRPLKSAVCVKNHFKRSHCPKMYSCNRCNKKRFSVLADLKSHLKNCGDTKWKCSCGTSFSRKDKLFGHMALFEGHMPAVAVEEEEVVEGGEKGKGAVVMVEDDEEVELNPGIKDGESKEIGMKMDGTGSMDSRFFDGLILDQFGSIENYCLQDILSSPNSAADNSGMDDFLNF